MAAAKNALSRTDTCIALGLVAVMAVAFSLMGGKPLIVTFVVGLAGVAAVILIMFRRQTGLPDPLHYYPIYFATLAWQLIHFTEEFWTGFQSAFPVLYGAAPYGTNFFVTINTVSYSIFIMTCIAVLTGKARFLVVPMLFFVIYGGIGNAIAHTWWVLYLGEYFPGFYERRSIGFWVHWRWRNCLDPTERQLSLRLHLQFCSFRSSLPQ
jgi:hypothetical protein